MSPLSIAKLEVTANLRVSLRSGFVSRWKNMLIPDGLPESLDKEIIPSGALAIHAGSNLIACEEFRKS